MQKADPEDIAIMFQLLSAASLASSFRESSNGGAQIASLMATSSQFCPAPSSFTHVAAIASETLADRRGLDGKGAERASRSTEDTKKEDLRYFAQLHSARQTRLIRARDELAVLLTTSEFSRFASWFEYSFKPLLIRKALSNENSPHIDILFDLFGPLD